MGSEKESDVGTQRRTILKALGVAAGAGTLSTVGAGQSGESEFAVVQDDRCIPVTPLSGDERVEELYDWRASETGYSSAGTTDLQRDDTSILFLYDGPNGTSLVLVHGHYRGGEDEGGSVSMTFEGLPEDGEWAVEDDLYDSDSNYDNWNHEGSRSEIDWTVRFNRTDGGAFRGLDDDASITIEPAFNEDSHFGDQHYTSTITDWQVLSGDRDDPDRVSLDMEQSITVRAGGCDAIDDIDGVGGTGDEDPTGGEETEEPQDGDGSDEDGDDSSSDERADVVVDQDVDGTVRTDGSVLVEAGVEVDGSVAAGGDVEIEDGGGVDGNIEAGGDVTVGSDSDVDGNIRAGEGVSVGPDGEIDGNVEATGVVKIRSGSEVDGNVTGSSVDVADSAEVDGRDDDEDDDDERSGDDDDDSGDRRRTKHEKRQRKHEKKHEKRQRKHEKEREKEQKKHDKQQRKHEKQRERKRKKHEKQKEKHEKKRRKHDRDDSRGLGDVLGAVDDALGGED